MPDSARGATIPAVLLSYIFGRRGYTTVGTDDDKDPENGDDEDELDPLSENLQTVDIPPDAYGAAILAFVRDVPQVLYGESGPAWDIAVISCIFSMIVLFLNLVLQVSILAYVYRYVVNPDVGLVQNQYAEFRLQVFDSSGMFQDDLWRKYEGRSDLCQIAMWNRPFYYSVLFCWTLVMLIEIRKSEELTRNLLSVPLCENPSKMVVKKGQDMFVVAFTRATRHLILAFVAIPKIGIGIMLLWLGCEWLSATIKFESLVMNTVAMAFIVNIDEILFEAILPAHHRNEVENIDFLLDKGEVDSQQDILQRKQAFRSSFWYMFFACVFLVCYAEYLQDVLPPDITMLGDRCKEFIDEYQQPFCNGWTWYLRGNPSARECFPFPAASEFEGVPVRSVDG